MHHCRLDELVVASPNCVLLWIAQRDVTNKQTPVKALTLLFWLSLIMMTSPDGNICRATGPLCREFTGHRWIPITMASDAELWCLLWSAPWIKGWINSYESGHLRRHRTHYHVIEMCYFEVRKGWFGLKVNEQVSLIESILFSMIHFGAISLVALNKSVADDKMINMSRPEASITDKLSKVALNAKQKSIVQNT